MSIHVSGAIHAAQADRSHSEPQPLTGLQAKAGEEAEYSFAGFSNNGNIDQTVRVDSISDAVGCSFVSADFVDETDARVGDTITLAPGKSARVLVKVKFEDLAFGADDADFSFNIAPVWS